MTDLNTQMTPEAMMQAQIDRLTAERDDARNLHHLAEAALSSRNVELVRAQKLEAAAQAEITALREAIAVKGGNEHYPTEDAYLSCCVALETQRYRAEKAERELAILRAYRDSNQTEGVR